MLIKVIKDSVIHRGVIYKKGEGFECDEAVANSLIDRGFAEKLGEVRKGFLDPEQFNDYSLADLKKLAADMGLPTTGKKSELIERICAEEVEFEPEPISPEEEPVDGGQPEEEPEDGEDGPMTSMPE